jgi:hypothetical protein
MVAVVLDAEPVRDDFGDSGGGPKVGAVSAFDGALDENFSEPLLLPWGELGWTTRNRNRFKPRFSAFIPRLPPALNRNRSAI